MDRRTAEQRPRDVPRTSAPGFLGGSPEVVAPELLGWTLQATGRVGTVAVRITEVEAYGGDDDPASHAWRGRTSRNDVMFGPAGRLYVYLSHGIHACANVVVGPQDQAAAVLLRAGEVVTGEALVRRRRQARRRLSPLRVDALARGPGNLGQAFGLTVADSGADLRLAPWRWTPPAQQVTAIRSGPRVGVSRAADVPWRFWLEGESTVSAYRRSTRAR